MGFVLKYCQNCGKRIPQAEFDAGSAVDIAGQTYCAEHRPADVPVTPAPPATRSAARTARSPGRVPTSKRARSVAPARPRDGGAAPRRSGRRQPTHETPRAESRVRRPRPTRESTSKRGAGGLMLGIGAGCVVIAIVVLVMSQSESTPPAGPGTSRPAGSAGPDATPNAAASPRTPDSGVDAARVRQRLDGRVSTWLRRAADFRDDWGEDEPKLPESIAKRAEAAATLLSEAHETAEALEALSPPAAWVPALLAKLDEPAGVLAEAAASGLMITLEREAAALAERYDFAAALDRLDQAATGADAQAARYFAPDARWPATEGRDRLAQARAAIETQRREFEALSERERAFLRAWTAERTAIARTLENKRADWETLAQAAERLKALLEGVGFARAREQTAATRQALGERLWRLARAPLRQWLNQLYPPAGEYESVSRRARWMQKTFSDPPEELAELLDLAERRRAPLAGLEARFKAAREFEPLLELLGEVDGVLQYGLPGAEKRRAEGLRGRVHRALKKRLEQTRHKYTERLTKTKWRSQVLIYLYRFPSETELKEWLPGDDGQLDGPLVLDMLGIVRQHAGWELRFTVFERLVSERYIRWSQLPGFTPELRTALSRVAVPTFAELFNELAARGQLVDANRRDAEIVASRSATMLEFLMIRRQNAPRPFRDALAPVQRLQAACQSFLGNRTAFVPRLFTRRHGG